MLFSTQHLSRQKRVGLHVGRLFHELVWSPLDAVDSGVVANRVDLYSWGLHVFSPNEGSPNEGSPNEGSPKAFFP
jgi:hypothetical protein